MRIDNFIPQYISLHTDYFCADIQLLENRNVANDLIEKLQYFCIKSPFLDSNITPTMKHGTFLYQRNE